jgi:nucleotide-binding universal stress UspA family protein
LEPESAIVPEPTDVPASRGLLPEEPVRCGRWKLKPFELPRPVILRPDGPLSLRDFLAHLDPTVLDELKQLDEEGLQELALARLAGAPPEMRLSLFGTPGYTMRDVVQHVREGTPLGVRVIDAERKLVGLLVTEALRTPD